MLSEIIDGIRQVLDLIETGRRILRGVLERLDETAAQYATIMRGSAAPESDEITADLTRARHQATVGLAVAEQSRQLIAAYLASIAGSGAPGISAGDAALPVRIRHAAKISEAQARLGRGVRGSETRGAWPNPDGSIEDIRSGIDTPWYRRAKAIFGGFGNLRYTRLARHCEGQAVVRIQKEQLREATIILDRAPCGTPPDPADEWTCDQKLDDIMRRVLPVGSTLTVIDPDGTCGDTRRRSGRDRACALVRVSAGRSARG
jgi:SCP1.201-like deaminase